MVEIDWKTFTGLKPEKLSEKEKDNLYETVLWFVPDSNVEKKNLIHFIRISQEVLKFKGEQVESLTNELDDIAARQGREESQYKEEIEQLKEELEYHKRIDRSSSKSTYGSNEDLKREIVKLELQNEELLGELKEKEKDLMNEKEEIEKYAGQVARLEKEKQELTRELRALQDETTDKSFRSVKDSPELGAEKHEQLTEIIRQKNKHISQLLEDIEVIEEENSSLRNKLASVRDELSETTTHITEITAELAKLKQLNEEHESRNIDSSEKIKGLKFQIEELVEEKNKHDKQLDEYIMMFNSKLEEWKSELYAKDEEIMTLKEEIEKLHSSPSAFASGDVTDKKLILKLQQQEEEIKILKQELEKATEEINNCSELIEKLKERQLQSVPVPQHNQTNIKFYEEKIKVLEEKLCYAEEDAIAKAEEMSNLVIQLREYESGCFGLPEAVNKIKRLEKYLQEKDSQIEKLVEICNTLEIKLDSFEEQNLSLRDKLGLTASDEIDTSNVKLRYRRDEEILQKLKLQLDHKEDELVKTKLKYRKVVKFLKAYPPETLKYASEKPVESQKCVHDEKLQLKLEAIIKENDSLRKGMHEILESIRQQDLEGTIDVQSTCLERLLEALDSRHVSGWYHPAMRLQAQLSTEEGKNVELRNQIKSLKTEEKKRVSELQNAYLKIQSLEQLSTPRYEEEKKLESKSSESEEGGEEEEEKIFSKRSSNYFDQEQKIILLETEMKELRVKLDQKTNKMEKLENDFTIEKENLLSKIAQLEFQVNEYKNLISDDNLSKLPEVTSQIVVLERKVNFLQKLEESQRESNEKIKLESLENEEKALKEILKLQEEKSSLITHISNLKEELLNAVPKEKYYALKKDLANAITKHQFAISLSTLGDKDDYDSQLQAEIDLLKNEKKEIFDELRIVKEKLIATEGLMNEETVTKGDFSNEISVLAGKLAACEVRELNERQTVTHLEKLNELLKTQQEEMQLRNTELLDQITKLTEDVAKYQEVERDLRSKVFSNILEDEVSTLKSTIESMQEKYDELLTEKENIQELFEISQGQCRAFQEWKDSDKIRMSSLNEQVLLLQSLSDEKATISRLSHELTMAKLMYSQQFKNNNDLKMKVTKLLSQNVTLEMKMTEKSRDYLNEKRKQLSLIEYLYEAMDEVRRLYGGSVRFRDIEKLYSATKELKEKKNDFLQKTKDLEAQIYEYSLKKEEMETQLESLEDLKQAFRGNSDNLISWHNRSTELRLKETKCRRKNEFLMGEVTQLENNLKKLNEELAVLEEENVKIEKEWELKQVLWEKAQLQICELLKDKGTKKKTVQDASTSPVIFMQKQDLSSQDREKLKLYESKIKELEGIIAKLKAENNDKVEIITLKQKEIAKTRTKSLEDIVTRDTTSNTEKEALKVTIESLQNIIKQKEETIIRYQDLLKEGREEYSKAYGKLQEELRSLNETMAAQSKAYSKLKSSVQAKSLTNENIPLVVEKYVTKIHELEEELRECQMNFANAVSQGRVSQQEKEKWKEVANERQTQIEDLKRRLETEHRSETDNYKEEVKNLKMEVGRLNKFLDSLQKENLKPSVITKQQTEIIQPKLVHSQSDHMLIKSDQLSDCTFDKPQRLKDNQLTREIESLKRQLKFSRDESTRLREQVRLLQARPKKSKTAGSITTRSDSRLSFKEESLTTKIKNLEELLSVSKEREKELMDINIKKLKSTEEVARWDERKKSQQTIQNLNLKLKEKEAEVEVLKNKNESFRNMIYKCERDKSILEAQLKAARGGPGGISAKLEKVTAEKNQLEAELTSLKNAMEEHMRHSGGLGAMFLEGKLEEQERKLAAFELVSMGQATVVEELERLKSSNANLEKLNLKLESENLSLQLKLEKEKAESRFLLDKLKRCQEGCDEMKIQELERTVSNLHKTIEKLTEENKRLKSGQKEVKGYGAVEKVRQELTKVREDHKILREKYMEAVEKNIAMEKEIKSYRYQIHLMEEKDLAEALSKTNTMQSTSELVQELREVKAKLAHKTHLLGKVKALLVKAAAKEKALHQEVCFLQSMVPKMNPHP